MNMLENVAGMTSVNAVKSRLQGPKREIGSAIALQWLILREMVLCSNKREVVGIAHRSGGRRKFSQTTKLMSFYHGIGMYPDLSNGLQWSFFLVALIDSIL
jgi:hypothetical protein